jgi:hypothetical protein
VHQPTLQHALCQPGPGNDTVGAVHARGSCLTLLTAGPLCQW